MHVHHKTLVAPYSPRAYEMYLERGGQHGLDFDDWVRAERELRRR